MSLFDDYKKTNLIEVIAEGVPAWLVPELSGWLEDFSLSTADPYEVAVDLKTRLRIEAPIPRTRSNNYLPINDQGKLLYFLISLMNDPELFFASLDYLLQHNQYAANMAGELEEILLKAGHKYTLSMEGEDFPDHFCLVERLSKTDKVILIPKNGEEVYKSHRADAFGSLYGRDPDYTKAAKDAFQCLESALDFYKIPGKNLGDKHGWLRDNPASWKFTAPAQEQQNAEEHFLVQIDFVNKAGRKLKHGEGDVRHEATREQAEVLYRVVSTLLYELENVIQVTVKS